MILFDSFFCFQVQKRIHTSSMRGQSRSFSWLLAWMDAIFPPPTLSSFRSRLPLFLCRLVVLLTLFPWPGSVQWTKHSNWKPRQAAKQNKGRSSPCLPHNRDRKIAITSALPYVNNIPHPSNTSTKTKAREEGISLHPICDKYYKLHKEICQGGTDTESPGHLLVPAPSRTVWTSCTERGSLLTASWGGGCVPLVWVQGYQWGPEWCQWEADNWMIRKPPGFLT